MSTNIDLEKVNYNDFIDKLMKNPKINNKELLEKILLEFGNHIGEDLVLLHNEYLEKGICTWNMCSMIDEVFKLDESKEKLSYDIYLNLREDLIKYKEIDEAYNNLELVRDE